MSLPLLFHYLMLNMFRMLIHPSSGAWDLFVELFHGLYCSGSMCVGVTLWFGWGVVVPICRLQTAFGYHTNGIKLISGIFPEGESNGNLPPRTCPGCSVPEPYRSHDWALVPAKPGLQGWILMNEWIIPDFTCRDFRGTSVVIADIWTENLILKLSST